MGASPLPAVSVAPATKLHTSDDEDSDDSDSPQMSAPMVVDANAAEKAKVEGFLNRMRGTCPVGKQKKEKKKNDKKDDKKKMTKRKRKRISKTRRNQWWLVRRRARS